MLDEPSAVMGGIISTVMLVRRLCKVDLSPDVEFHIDGLGFDSLGDVCELELLLYASTELDVVRVAEIVKEGTILQVHGSFCYTDGRISFICPDYRSVGKEEMELREKFDRFLAKNKEEPETFDVVTEKDGMTTVSGEVYECKILATKRSGPMAFLKMDIDGEDIEVIVFAKLFAQCKDQLTSLGNMSICGKLQMEDDGTAKKLLAEQVSL